MRPHLIADKQQLECDAAVWEGWRKETEGRKDRRKRGMKSRQREEERKKGRMDLVCLAFSWDIWNFTWVAVEEVTVCGAFILEACNYTHTHARAHTHTPPHVTMYIYNVSCNLRLAVSYVPSHWMNSPWFTAEIRYVYSTKWCIKNVLHWILYCPQGFWRLVFYKS